MISRRNIWNEVDRKRRRWEAYYTKAFKVLLNKQIRDMEGQITDDNARVADTVLKIDEKPVQNMMLTLYGSVGAAFARDTYRNLKPKFGDESQIEDRWEPFMRDYARTQTASRVTSITASSLDLAKRIIKRVVEEGVEEGLGSRELARLIREALTREMIPMNTWRALRIARTEVVGASNAGTMRGARDLQMPMNKVWITTMDDRTRDDHYGANGQTVDINEPFVVGGENMDAPGDGNASAGNIINCRCTVAHEVRRR